MDPGLLGQLSGVAVVAIVLVVFLFLSVRIVKEYERMVVFRLGRAGSGMVREPGLRFVIPFVDRPVMVDMRDRFVEAPSQRVITRDNAPIDIAFLVYYRIVDPMASVVNVSDFAAALEGLTVPTLRELVADTLLDHVIAKREQLDEALRASFDKQVEPWGGTVTTVEIREILPPPDVQEAMARALAAEESGPTRRLAELDRARDADLVTEAEYEAKRQEILDSF